MTDEECKTCGRPDKGHWLGCAEAAGANLQQASATRGYAAQLSDEECAFGDCKNPRRPKRKGPAPKFCETHSDPKNRK